MAANIEFELLSKSFLPISQVANLLDISGWSIEVQKIIAYNDWTCDAQKSKVLTESSQGRQVVDRGGILFVNLASVVRCPMGLQVYKGSDGINYSLWIDTQGKPELDCDLLTKDNKIIYDSFCDHLAVKFGEEIYIGAMGVEISVELESDIMQTIKNGRNVIRWILPQSSGDKNIKGFSHNKKYTKISVFDKI